ncbi:NAD(P)-binding protein [Patellaria atrata CBS 101060]|uniref:NAD(P)-binding protein n=1 Tax=Patellaria atrata CBS 101060 TaxID=1346257 RepID=A0A9P4VPA4_9PEZI|nr:NAD(P)-binding protein [Patellaria atrata CBS 101060]
MANIVGTTNLSLSGKVAIVTGASRGIGAAIALELAKRGAKVVLTYTSERSTKITEDLIAQIANFGNGAAGAKIQADLRELDAPAKIVSATRAAFGKSIDILVNNAGVEIVKSVLDVTPEDFASVFDLNVRGAYFMSQAVTKHLRSPGRIVNISSVGARDGYESMSVYSASKAALEGMTRGMAADLGAVGHTVNAVAPGPTESEMLDNIPESLKESQRKSTPVEHRFGTAEDIALVVAFLCEEQSRWLSGQTLSASGGFKML